MFIVQGKPRETGGIIKVVRETRKHALETAVDFLDQGIPFFSNTAAGRIYTAAEFAVTIVNDGRYDAPRT